MGVLAQVIEALRSEDHAAISAERLAEGVVELRADLDLLELEWTRRVAA